MRYPPEYVAGQMAKFRRRLAQKGIPISDETIAFLAKEKQAPKAICSGDEETAIEDALDEENDER